MESTTTHQHNGRQVRRLFSQSFSTCPIEKALLKREIRNAFSHQWKARKLAPRFLPRMTGLDHVDCVYESVCWKKSAVQPMVKRHVLNSNLGYPAFAASRPPFSDPYLHDIFCERSLHENKLQIDMRLRADGPHWCVCNMGLSMRWKAANAPSKPLLFLASYLPSLHTTGMVCMCLILLHHPLVFPIPIRF